MEGDEFKGTARFTIIRRLGQGGMGVVYEALDQERDHRVALKTVREMSGAALVRLKQEFRALQDLQHPNLVALYELIEDGGRWFFTMELVDGVGFLQHVCPGEDASPAREVSSRSPTVSPSATTWKASPARGLWEADGTSNGPGFDEQRLRRALYQVVLGLEALHGVGKVHRDVKPANIMVTRDGRVVLLDLGLVTGIREADQSTAMHAVGTAGYMAPEQAASQRVMPAADWYSLGVVLYQALTGQLPFSGTDLKVMIDKQHLEPTPPRELDERVPSDLNDLCCRLLRFAPQERPECEEIRRSLGEERAVWQVPPSGPPSSFTQTPPFVGRTKELAALEDAYQTFRQGTAVVVLVEGESGIGKTALVQRFTNDLATTGAVVLAGRCYERESVPYKGIDGVVDALGRFLRRLEGHEAAALLPRAAGLLGQVFPVLRRVKPIANAPLPGLRVEADPQEMRTRLFAAMRELVARLADRWPLVVVIDDLQWAGADSLALLSELLRPPEAPPLLAIAMMRSGTSLGTMAPLELGRSLPTDIRRIAVPRLASEEAEALSARLLHRAAGAHVVEPARIAAEADGHPLFIDELIRHVAAHGDEGTSSLRLDDALRRRVAELPAAPRRLLELVAVAGRPLPQSVVAEAADLDAGQLASSLGLLRVSNLAQVRGTRKSDLVGFYHDRVRESVAGALTDAERRAIHRDLALALEGAPHADPEALAEHWQEAGEPARALAHALRAATEAERAFSFDHAAHFYRQVLELYEGDAGERRRLQVKLGDALSNAGRGADAAAAYQEASNGAPAAATLELQRRAAEELIKSGHVNDGLAAVRKVLNEIGMSLPTTHLGALASFLWRRCLLRLRGHRFQPRDASEVSSVELAHIDTCLAVGYHLGMLDHIRGADYAVRSLLMALKAGEPWRLARSWAIECAYQGCARPAGDHHVERIVRLHADLVRRVGTPEARATLQGVQGLTSYYTGRLHRARDLCEEAEGLYLDGCTGTAWELATARTCLCWCLYYLGEIPAMARRVRRHEAEALERGDLYTVTSLRLGLPNTAWLWDGSVAEARRVAQDAYERCSLEAASSHHWYYLTYLAQTALHEGDGAGAYQAVQDWWLRLKRSYLLRVQVVRVEAWHLQGRAALAAARESPTGAGQEALLKETRRAARRLAREHLLWAAPLARLLEAGMAATQGQQEDAVSRATDAVRMLDDADMVLYAAAARSRLGKLMGGTAGEDLTQAADAFFAEAQIRNPEAWVAMLAPGF